MRSEKRVTAALTIANNSGQTYISGTMIIITITIKVMIVYGICFLMCWVYDLLSRGTSNKIDETEVHETERNRICINLHLRQNAKPICKHFQHFVQK